MLEHITKDAPVVQSDCRCGVVFQGVKFFYFLLIEFIFEGISEYYIEVESIH